MPFILPLYNVLSSWALAWPRLHGHTQCNNILCPQSYHQPPFHRSLSHITKLFVAFWFFYRNSSEVCLINDSKTFHIFYLKRETLQKLNIDIDIELEWNCLIEIWYWNLDCKWFKATLRASLPVFLVRFHLLLFGWWKWSNFCRPLQMSIWDVLFISQTGIIVYSLPLNKFQPS